MTFINEKKTFLAKLDKSKKGNIDEKVVSLLEIINNKLEYYTTSSCSGRVYLWRGSGKKNETEWLKVSHDLIAEDFFEVKDKDFEVNDEEKSLIWLRLEPLLLHVACKDLDSANKLLNTARRIYKNSNLLSASKKIIVEIQGSEFIEMPFYWHGKSLFSGETSWLKELINGKLKEIWKRTEILRINLKR